MVTLRLFVIVKALTWHRPNIYPQRRHRRYYNLPTFATHLPPPPPSSLLKMPLPATHNFSYIFFAGFRTSINFWTVHPLHSFRSFHILIYSFIFLRLWETRYALFICQIIILYTGPAIQVLCTAISYTRKIFFFKTLFRVVVKSDAAKVSSILRSIKNWKLSCNFSEIFFKIMSVVS